MVDCQEAVWFDAPDDLRRALAGRRRQRAEPAHAVEVFLDLDARPYGIAGEQLVELVQALPDPGRMRLRRRRATRRLKDCQLGATPRQLAVELPEFGLDAWPVAALGHEPHEVFGFVFEPRDLGGERLGPGAAPLDTDCYVRIHQLDEPFDRVRVCGCFAEPRDERAL